MTMLASRLVLELLRISKFTSAGWFTTKGHGTMDETVTSISLGGGRRAHRNTFEQSIPGSPLDCRHSHSMWPISVGRGRELAALATGSLGATTNRNWRTPPASTWRLSAASTFWHTPPHALPKSLISTNESRGDELHAADDERLHGLVLKANRHDHSVISVHPWRDGVKDRQRTSGVSGFKTRGAARQARQRSGETLRETSTNARPTANR